MCLLFHNRLLKFIRLQPPNQSFKFPEHQTQLNYLPHRAFNQSFPLASPSDDTAPYTSSPLFLQRPFLSLLLHFLTYIPLELPPKSNLASFKGQTAGMDRWFLEMTAAEEKRERETKREWGCGGEGGETKIERPE